MTEQRKVQLLELDLLKVFIKICEENNFTYYLTGGGLIGVLRHKGFIPWDDDLDIVMPRKDYDAFVEYCKYSTPFEGYGLKNDETNIDSDWIRPYSCFVDLNTEVEWRKQFSSEVSYLWADIYPVDGLPNNRLLRYLHVKRIMFLRYLLVLSNIDILAGEKRRSFVEKCVLRFFRCFPIFRLIGSRKILKTLKKSMRKYPIEGSLYCANLAGLYREREVQPSERWGNPIIMKFEGVDVAVPQKYHEFQTHMYGDYMKLPPVEKQKGHNVHIIKSRFDYSIDD